LEIYWEKSEAAQRWKRTFVGRVKVKILPHSEKIVDDFAEYIYRFTLEKRWSEFGGFRGFDCCRA
jgi:hypothetical protein